MDTVVGGTAAAASSGASAAEDFERRAEILIRTLRRSEEETRSTGDQAGNPQDGEPSVAFASALLELVQVASQLTQVDTMAGKAASAISTSSSDSEEVQKWRDLSMCALQWSRSALEKRQQGATEELQRASDVALRPSLPSASELSLSVAVAPALMAAAIATPARDGADAAVPPPPGFAPPPPGVAPLQALSDEPALASVTLDESAEDSAGEAGADVPAPDVRQLALEEFEKGGTLRTHLERMNGEDPRCILVVRRINRLGFQSPTLLEEYFERFGGTRRVLVAHSRVKPSTKRPAYRIRPAGLGFVVMASPESAEQVVNIQMHEINGVMIEVSYYKDRAGALGLEDGDIDGLAAEEFVGQGEVPNESA